MKQDNYCDGYTYVIKILERHGEISEEEIRALPIFKNRSESKSVIEALKYDSNIKTITRKVSDWPMLEWQKIFRFSP